MFLEALFVEIHRSLCLCSLIGDFIATDGEILLKNHFGYPYRFITKFIFYYY